MAINRRNFLKQSGFAAAGSLLVPRFVSAFNNSPIGLNDKKLVIIQLSGGNDGLNTIIPYRNDHYYELRPKIAIPKSEVLKVSDELGFHPAMEALRPIYDEGNLSIINNVGYPNPSLSHFRAMDIWQTGSGSEEFLSHGWIGRYLDSNCQNGEVYDAIEMDDTLSMALKGEKQTGIAVRDPRMLYRLSNKSKIDETHFKPNARKEENLNYLYKTMESTMSSAEYIHAQSKIYKSSLSYPTTGLGHSLQLIAQLLISRIKTKVFYVSLSGFDTHAHQPYRQRDLLKTYAEAVKVFTDDLKKNNVLEDTLIITFSEFGRRVKENASKGTDHGKANNMFVMGGKLKEAGFYNETPNLKELDNGNLQHTIDFRQVYATALDNWLKADSSAILGQQFNTLNLV